MVFRFVCVGGGSWGWERGGGRRSVQVRRAQRYGATQRRRVSGLAAGRHCCYHTCSQELQLLLSETTSNFQPLTANCQLPRRTWRILPSAPS